jgi:large subunit ribosomal protein L5
MAPRLREKYQNEVVQALMQEFKYSTVMQVPRLEKVVLNIGLGEALQNNKALDAAVGDLSAISGQKPVITKAKKSIAAFKLRQGQSIGAMVTLRGVKMYDFLDRLMNLALPRLRDFRGISRRSFDGRGNYSLGLREQIIFPEIDYDKVDKIRGLEVAIVTTAPDDAQGYALLKRLGMPFRD